MVPVVAAGAVVVVAARRRRRAGRRRGARRAGVAERLRLGDRVGHLLEVRRGGRVVAGRDGRAPGLQLGVGHQHELRDRVGRRRAVSACRRRRRRRRTPPAARREVGALEHVAVAEADDHLPQRRQRVAGVVEVQRLHVQEALADRDDERVAASHLGAAHADQARQHRIARHVRREGVERVELLRRWRPTAGTAGWSPGRTCPAPSRSPASPTKPSPFPCAAGLYERITLNRSVVSPGSTRYAVARRARDAGAVRAGARRLLGERPRLVAVEERLGRRHVVAGERGGLRVERVLAVLEVRPQARRAAS